MFEILILFDFKQKIKKSRKKYWKLLFWISRIQMHKYIFDFEPVTILKDKIADFK